MTLLTRKYYSCNRSDFQPILVGPKYQRDIAGAMSLPKGIGKFEHGGMMGSRRKWKKTR
jgi:hypothetical protein